MSDMRTIEKVFAALSIREDNSIREPYQVQGTKYEIQSIVIITVLLIERPSVISS